MSERNIFEGIGETVEFEIDNCTTDLDTLIALDKRAIKDLENNTHEIKQHEVLTIIREFIRLRNDYKQEKEKNKELEKYKTYYEEMEEVNKKFIAVDKIKELLENETIDISGFRCIAVEDIEELLEEK